MCRIVGDGLKAGALGFSTSRTIGHRSVLGEPKRPFRLAYLSTVHHTPFPNQPPVGIRSLFESFDQTVMSVFPV